MMIAANDLIMSNDDNIYSRNPSSRGFDPRDDWEAQAQESIWVVAKIQELIDLDARCLWFKTANLLIASFR